MQDYYLQIKLIKKRRNTLRKYFYAHALLVPVGMSFTLGYPDFEPYLVDCSQVLQAGIGVEPAHKRSKFIAALKVVTFVVGVEIPFSAARAGS